MGHGNSDKLYITHAEWSGNLGQHGAASGIASRKPKSNFRRLPFYCCALSLQPFEHPVCSPNGTVFDLLSIIPYLKKYGTNPVTGEKLTSSDLIKLHFFKNSNGEYHCPITAKVFNDHTHIVAIRTTGNVFAYDAVEKLNIKTKMWRDLVSDEPFSRNDIITIQDPHNLENRNLSTFHHLKNDLHVTNDEEEERARSNPLSGIKSSAARKLAEKVTQNSKTSDELINKPSESTHYNQTVYSKGLSAASFTSTSLTPVTKNETAVIDDETYMFKQMKHMKEHSIIKMETNCGDMTFTLYCNKAPKTCYNFIMLSKKGYYSGVGFHRNIKGFMIQGGDPTGTGRGGESIWGKEFEDEFDQSLGHGDRGVLSMANKGPRTNTSQFFITYGSANHLDGKHTVFGHITLGLEVLDIFEQVPNMTDPTTGKVDTRPAKAIIIKNILVLKDPYDKFRVKLERKREREEHPEKYTKKVTEDDTKTWLGNTVSGLNGSRMSKGKIGKYLHTNLEDKTQEKQELSVSTKRKATNDVQEKMLPPTIKKSKGYKFGSFDNW